MLNRSSDQLSKPAIPYLQFALAFGVGGLIGASSVWLPPLWTFGALTGVFFLFAFLQRHELLPLVILILQASIFAVEGLPKLALGPGNVLLPDFFFLLSFCLIFIRWLAEPKFRFVRTPLDLPLLTFFSIAVLSTFLAIFSSSVELGEALGELRVLSYYLTFFVVTNLVRQNQQLTFLLRGVSTVATFVAGAMLVQFLLGESRTILPGRVETLGTANVSYDGITRILPPGASLILLVFITTAIGLVLSKVKVAVMVILLQLGLLGLAIILTFNRNFWVIVGVAFILLFFLVNTQERRKVAGWGLAFLTFLALVAVFIPTFTKQGSKAQELIQATVARMITLRSDDTLQENSLNDRFIETNFAVQRIGERPILGLGLGSEYRPALRKMDWVDWGGTRYIHNAHLWILMKTGFLGYFCFLWLVVTFFVRSFTKWRQVSSMQKQNIVLGFALTYLGVFIGALVNPMFMQSFWTPVLGFMMGVNETIFRMDVR